MKVTVEINLPWIDDDGHLHDEMEYNVIDQITRKINNQILIDLKPRIDSIMNDSINNTVDTILHNYLSKPVVISNGFKKEEYESAYNMIETKISMLYDPEFKQANGSCKTDPLLVKMEAYIKQSIQTLIRSSEEKLQREASKIASATLKESSLYTAFEKLVESKK